MAFFRLNTLLSTVPHFPSFSVLGFLHSHTPITKISGRFCQLLSNPCRPC